MIGSTYHYDYNPTGPDGSFEQGYAPRILQKSPTVGVQAEDPTVERRLRFLMSCRIVDIHEMRG